MKKSKKLLALILVLAMALTFVPIAGAKDATEFNDWGSVKNEEAVAILANIGVITGYPDGSFGPGRTITRMEAAAIVARMLLGKDIADSLAGTPTPFPDVPSSHWASGVIAYCASQGIIVGYPNGNFGPGDTLTGFSFLAMLLRALGYGKNGEYTGDFWTINVLTDAHSNNLTDGVEVNLNSGATRDNISQFAFNMLNKGVEVQETVTIVRMAAGTGFTMGTHDFLIPLFEKEWSSVNNNDPRAAAIAEATALGAAQGPPITVAVGVQYVLTSENTTRTVVKDSLGARVFDLSKVTTPDAFGRPGSRWFKGSDAILEHFPNTARATYVAPVAESKIFADLGLTSNVDNAVRFVDGLRTTGNNIRFDNSSTYGGNGTLTEVYRSGSNVTIIEINTYISEVGSVTDATAIAKRSVTLSTVFAPIPHAANFRPSFETSSFKGDDVVIYTASTTDDGANYRIRTMQLAEKKLMTAASWSPANFVADGVTYRYNVNMKGAPLTNLNENEVYLDNNNFVLWVNAPTAPTNYAILLREGTDTGIFGSKPMAELALASGEVVIVEIAAPTAFAAGTIVTYTVQWGVYTLSNPAPTTQDANALALDLKKGVSRIAWGPNVYFGNDDTLYIVRTGPDWDLTFTPYTGFANVPNLSGNAVVGRVLHTSNVARVVYIINPIVEATTDVIFVATVSSLDKVTTPSAEYYVTDVLVNGVVETLYLADTYAAGLYTIRSVSNGITTLSSTGYTAPAAATLSRSPGVINVSASGFTDGSFAPASTIKVYEYNRTSGEIKEVTQAAAIPALPAAARVCAGSVITYSSGNATITNIFIDVTP